MLAMKLSKVAPTTVLVAAALIAAPTGASGATQIGQTFDPSSSACPPDRTWLQDKSPSDQYALPYAVPLNWVITSWSFRAGNNPPSQIELKVGRYSPDPYLGPLLGIVGESAPETPAANRLNTFS